MYCPYCGSSIPNNTQFCTNCGAQISNQNKPEDSRHTEPPADSFSQAPTAPSSGVPGAIKTDRDVVTYALLDIVTCGIYGFWYVYTLARDSNTICEGDGETTPELAPFILLSIVTCGIYSFYWLYKLANRLQNNSQRYGISIQENGSDVLVWLILGCFLCRICSYVGVNIIIKNMNTLAEAYNRANGYVWE